MGRMVVDPSLRHFERILLCRVFRRKGLIYFYRLKEIWDFVGDTDLRPEAVRLKPTPGRDENCVRVVLPVHQLALL